ncbi:MAG TPA: glycosyltransferase [Anaerolineae bacterium]|nr:glycosyltransferase [Anaerolineae bacterium]
MHLLILTSEFPPDLGGIATYLEHSARMLTRAGHHVTIIAPGDARCDKQLPDGTRLIRLIPHQTTSVPAFFQTLSHWPALSYEIAETAINHLRSTGDLPDVIEVQEYGALGYYLLQRRLVDETPLRDIPILVHLHSPHSENLRVNQMARYRFPDYWVGQMEKFCINAADALLSPSRFLRDKLLKQGFTDRSIDVIPYAGIDPSILIEDFDSPVDPQPEDIVYIGRLEVRKGVLPLVKASARLWAEGTDFRLTLIGGDTVDATGRTVGTIVREKYRHFIRSGHLTLLEAMPQEQVLARLRSAWAVVVPSLYENYPYACIEAMAAGKVVVASTSGGQAEMIGSDGQAGWLFDWADDRSFDCALLSALSMTVDENRAMGARARQRIATLTSYDVILPERIAHYQKTIEQASTWRRSRIFPSVNWDLRPAMDGARVYGEEAHEDLLSVVIPFYNLGRYLKETLTSILASTYGPLEVIIIDDGSDEPSSLAVLERVRAQDQEHVRVIRTDNQGLALARNCGAEAARGEYLAFVDADDLVLPDFFARAIHVLKSFDNVGFVYSWVQYFDDNNEWWPTWNTEFPYLLGHNMLVPIVVMRRSVFLHHTRNRPTLEHAYEDWDAWVRLAAAGYQGVSLPHLLVKYRVRSDSMFRRMSVDQSLYLHDLIAQGSPEVYGRYALELFNLMNANGPHYLWVHPAMQAQHANYNRMKAIFFWLASRPGLGWMHQLKMPLKRLYDRFHL